jgi:transcriptional regulator with XRE-family HTH domain
MVELLVDERKKAGLTQAEVASRLGRYQSFIATVESGQRRIDVVEFIAIAEAIGFDPGKAVRALAALKC